MADIGQSEAGGVPQTRYRDLGKALRWVFRLFTLLMVLIAANYIFGWRLAGVIILNITYYYILMGLLMPFVFLLIRGSKAAGNNIPWYDYIAALLAFALPVYFSFYAWDILEKGWATYLPLPFFFMGVVFVILVVEAARRAAGKVYAIVVVAFLIYPLVAEHMPGVLKGFSLGMIPVLGHNVFGPGEGILGVPMRVIGELLIGFYVFTGVLLGTGAGNFFMNLAMALTGRTRGGPAKVAVVGSAFFGSMSGSVLANVLATGQVTIPLMKRVGYPPEYAGAVEACASTGGILMPPIMGAVAFVMAEITGIPYSSIIAAAFIPSILYYSALLLQVDAFAAKTGLKGVPGTELPSLWATFKQGWHFLFCLAFLVFGLVYMRWEAMTPFYATGLLLLLCMLKKETRLTPARLVAITDATGKLMVEIMAMILALGLIIAGLQMTGMAAALAGTIVQLSMGIPIIALLLGAVVLFVLGLVGMLTPAYIFLAITMAPVLVQQGMNIMAVHLFIVYYAMLSMITPPVAMAAFIASTISGANPTKTSWQAMKLGIVLFFIPFFFVFEPALVLQGAPLSSLLHIGTAAAGIVFIAAGFEGYLWGIGRVGTGIRALFIVAGALITFPDLMITVLGAALVAPPVVFLLTRKRALKGRPVLSQLRE